jgi:hypothetical protein
MSGNVVSLFKDKSPSSVSVLPIDIEKLKWILLEVSSDDDYKFFSNETGVNIDGIDALIDNPDVHIHEVLECVEESEVAWEAYFFYLFVLYSELVDPYDLIKQNPFFTK